MHFNSIYARHHANIGYARHHANIGSSFFRYFACLFHLSSVELPNTMTYALNTLSGIWCHPPAPSLGWCRLSFPAAWLCGPWCNLRHYSQWPKPPGTTVFPELTAEHWHRKWFYGSIALGPFSARNLWDFLRWLERVRPRFLRLYDSIAVTLF